jgi:hypothetical protein
MKKVIFSINTGRSGSKFIASLCKGFDNVSSYHEPYPALCGKEMRAYQLGDENAMNELILLKVKKIKEALTQKPIYFESNHYFIKGFGWKILDLLKEEDIEVAVIILKRDPNKIVESFYKIGTSLIGKGAVNHLIHPRAKIVKDPFFKYPSIDYAKLFFFRVLTMTYNFPYYLGLRKLKSFSLFQPYQKRYLYWYIEQYEYLKQKWKQRYPHLKYLEISLDMDEDKVVSLLEKALGMNHFQQPQIDRNTGADYVEIAKKNKLP